jgi:hypothetical protein
MRKLTLLRFDIIERSTIGLAIAAAMYTIKMKADAMKLEYTYHKAI